jgi:hypothetical protein
MAHILRSSRCSDSVCFLRDFCRVDNVAGRRTPDPEAGLGHLWFLLRNIFSRMQAMTLRAERVDVIG